MPVAAAARTQHQVPLPAATARQPAAHLGLSGCRALPSLTLPPPRSQTTTSCMAPGCKGEARDVKRVESKRRTPRLLEDEQISMKYAMQKPRNGRRHAEPPELVFQGASLARCGGLSRAFANRLHGL